jgi:hypothetical protein
MAESVAFKPNGNEPFTFRATVGGTELFATVPFNLYANRYYLKLTDNSGATKVYVPLVASPDDYDINLALPYEPGKLVYRATSGIFEFS